MYFVYLIRCTDNSLYCGITNNLEKRLRMHNGEIKGGAKYTRGRRPVYLETYATLPSKEEALHLEHEVKKKHVHEKISFLKNFTYPKNIPQEIENTVMNSLTFSFPPLANGDFCTLFFTEAQKENLDIKNTSQEASLKLSLQAPYCIENAKHNFYAISHNLDLGLKIPSGTLLFQENSENQKALFCVHAVQFHPLSAYPVLLLRCLCDDFSNAPTKVKKKSVENKIHKHTLTCTFKKEGFSLAIITLSDKGFAGKREDRSGPALMHLLGELKVHEKALFTTKQSFMLPDEIHALRGLVSSLAYTQGFECIITTGGTGLSQRDITPNALLPLLQSRLHGFEQAMMQKSLEKTPHAMLSRAFAGIIHKSLLVCVPGSVKAATENIEAILPALPHALDKLGGDLSDCGNESIFLKF